MWYLPSVCLIVHDRTVKILMVHTDHGLEIIVPVVLSWLC